MSRTSWDDTLYKFGCVQIGKSDESTGDKSVEDESITVESVNDQPVNEHITDESVVEHVNNPYCGVYNFLRMLHYYFSFMLDHNTYFQILVKGYFNSTNQLFLIAQVQQ